MSRNNYDNYYPNYESVAAGYTVSPTMPADAGAAFTATAPIMEPAPQMNSAVNFEATEPVQSRVDVAQRETEVDDALESDGMMIRPAVGWLVIIDGVQRGKSFALHTGRNYIGRGAECSVQVPDPQLSRKPTVEVAYDPKSRVFLIGSCTGVETMSYVNGSLLMGAQKLNAYDRLEVGTVKLLFVPLCGEQFAWDE